MERFSDARSWARNCSLKPLGNVIGVHVMHGFESEIRQKQFFSPPKASEYLRIEMSRRVEWFPTRPDNMPRDAKRLPSLCPSAFRITDILRSLPCGSRSPQTACGALLQLLGPRRSVRGPRSCRNE